MIGSVLSRPVAGKTVVVGSDGHDEIDLLFALRDVEYFRQGDDLVFRFPDGASIVLEHYFALPPKSRPVFFGNDQKPIPASVLAKAAADAPPASPAHEEEPATPPAPEWQEQPVVKAPLQASAAYDDEFSPQAGETAKPPVSREPSTDTAPARHFRQSVQPSEDKGGRYHDFDDLALAPGVDKLDGLDLGWNRAFSPERLPYGDWKWTDSAASGRVEPPLPSLGFAVPDGSVTEEAEGTFAGSVGIDGGTLPGGVFAWPELPRYGTFSGGADGRFSYVLDNDLPGVQSLAEGESVREVIRFVYRVDGKEMTGELVVTIRGTNDAPKIADVSRLELEADGVKDQGNDPNAEYTGATQIAGTVAAGDVDNDDTAETLQYAFAGGQRALRMAFGNLSIDASGRYVYTLDDRAKALAQGEERIERVEVLVTDRHGATDTATVEIVIRGTNDRPTLELGRPEMALTAQTQTGALPAITSEGTIARTDDADDGHSLTIGLGAADGPAAYLSGQPIALNGRYGFLMLRPNGSYTYTLNRSAEGGTVDASVALGAGETGKDIFYVYVKDEYGAWSRQEVTVCVAGANEPPTIDATGTTASVEVKESGVQPGGNTDTTDWTSGALDPAGNAHKLTASGTITVKDADVNDTHSFTAGNGAYGTVRIDKDGNYTYTLTDDASGTINGLKQGDSTTDTFEVTVSDGHGGEVTQTVTVTIHGTNDAPELELKYDGGSAAVQEDATLTATGTFLVKDADGDAGENQTFTVSGGIRTPDGTQYAQTDAVNKPDTADDVRGIYETDYGWLELDPEGNWTYTLDNTKSKTQALGEGQIVKEAFTVTVTDEHGATSQQALTVTITGSNDAPTIDAATDAVEVKEAGVHGGGNTGTTDWTGGALAPDGNAHKLTATGTIAVKDADVGDTHSFTAGNGTYGTVTIDKDGNYTYTLTDDASGTINGLKQGDSTTDTFTITVSDGHGGEVKQTVTVTIYGTNDRPTIAGEGLSDEELKALDALYAGQQTVYGDSTSISGNKTTLSGIREEGFKNGQDVSGNDVIHGKVKVDDVDSDDDPSTLQLGASTTGSDPSKATFVGAGGSVTIKGTYGDLILRADGTYTYQLDNKRAATDNLTDKDQVSDTFTVYVRDAHGAWAEHTVIVEIDGTTEDIHIDAGGYTHEAVEAGVAGGLFDDSKPDGGVSSGNNAAVAVLECKGVIDVSGVEGVTLTFGVEGAVPGADGLLTYYTGHGTLTLNVATGKYSFVPDQNLSAGQKATDTVTVTVAAQGQGGTASVELTFNITGTNDMPTIELNAPKVTFEQSVNTDAPAPAGGGSFSGNVHSSDPDADDGLGNVENGFNARLHYKILPVEKGQHATTVTEDANGIITAVTKFGTLTFNTKDGSYTYEVNQDPGFDWKDLPKDYKDTFTFRVIDSHGSYVDKTLSVPLNGINDVPTFSSGQTFPPLIVWEDGTKDSGTGKPISQGGTASADDADDGESPAYGFLVGGKFVDHYTVVIDGKAVGTMHIDPTTGEYSFTVDNSSTLVQSLYKWDGPDAAYGDPGVTDPNCINFGVTIVAKDKWSSADKNDSFAHEDITVTIRGQHDAPKFTHEEGAGYTHTLVEAGVEAKDDGSMPPVPGVGSVSGKVSASDADVNDTADTISYSLIIDSSFKNTDDTTWTNPGNVGTAGAAAIAGTTLEVVVGTYGYLVFDTDSQEYAYFLLNVKPGDTPDVSGISSAALKASIEAHWAALKAVIVQYADAAMGRLDALPGGSTNAVDEIWVFAWDKAGHVATQQLSFNISGTNDAPTVSHAEHTLQIGDTGADNFPSGTASLPSSGTHSLTGHDVDTGDKLSYSLVDENGNLVQILEGKYGYLTLNADGSYFYTLNAKSGDVIGFSEGQAVTETFNARVTDILGAHAQTTITINLSGKNEQGTLTAAKGTVKEDDASGALPETEHPAADWTVSGEVSITGDPDKNDTYRFSLSGTQEGVDTAYCYFMGIGGDGKPIFEYSTTFDGAKTLVGTLKLNALAGKEAGYTFTLNHAANELDFIQKLGIKDSIGLEGFNVYAHTYVPDGKGGTVLVPDGNYAGNIPIVIQGTDDKPVVNNNHANLTCSVEEDAALVAGNDLTFGGKGAGEVIYDIDNAAGDIACYFGTPGMLSWTGKWGTLVLYRNGDKWSYKYYLDNVKVKEAADFKGDKDEFTVTVDDGAGGKAELKITANVGAATATGGNGFTVNVAHTKDIVTEDGGNDPDTPDLQIIKTGYVAESIVYGSVTYTLVKEGVNEGKYLAPDGAELTGKGFYFYLREIGSDGKETHVQSVSDEYGSLVIDSRTGKWTYTLNNSSELVQGMRGGEAHEFKYEIGVGNGTANPTNATITITVEGADDLQSITGGDSLSVSQTYGKDNALILDGGSAELKVEDTDIVSGLGESAVHEGPFHFWFWVSGVQVSEYVVEKDGVAYGTLTMNPETGKYTFTFAEGAPHIVKGTSLTFDIPIQIYNNSSKITLDELLHLTLTGTNKGPEAFTFSTWDGTLAGTVEGDGTQEGLRLAVEEDGGARAKLSGAVIDVEDADGAIEIFTYGVSSSVSGTGKNFAAGAFGSFVIDPETGKYSYTLNSDLAEVQKLGKGDTAQDVFYVTVTDSSGASHTQSITVTVQGTNDAPVLTLGLPLHVTHDPAGGASNSAGDAFSVKDVDSPLDSLHYSVGEAVTDASGLTQNALSCYVLWDGTKISYVPKDGTLTPDQADDLLGTFSLDLASNTYAFDLAKDSLAVRSLTDGELKEFEVTVNVSDGSDVASSQVKVQITGTNDGPELLYGDSAADGQAFSIGASASHAAFSAAGHTHDADADQNSLRHLIDPDAREDELLFSFDATPAGSTLFGTTKLVIDGCGILTLDDRTGLISFERTGSKAWEGDFSVKVQDRHTATDILSDTQSLHFKIDGAAPSAQSAPAGDPLPDMGPLLARDSGEVHQQSFMACLFDMPQDADALAADAALPVPGYAEDQLATHVNMLMALNG